MARLGPPETAVNPGCIPLVPAEDPGVLDALPQASPWFRSRLVPDLV
jgi:hypothetical protein